MKYPILILIAALQLIITGCVTDKVRASGWPSGELLCNDSNDILPEPIRCMLKERHKRYHSMNQVDYGTLHLRCDLDQECYNKIMTLRWELARLNWKHDMFIDDLKSELRQDPCDDTNLSLGGIGNPDERIAKLIDQIDAGHDEYMYKSGCLLRYVEPYQPSLFDNIFYHF